MYVNSMVYMACGRHVHSIVIWPLDHLLVGWGASSAETLYGELDGMFSLPGLCLTCWVVQCWADHVWSAIVCGWLWLRVGCGLPMTRVSPPPVLNIALVSGDWGRVHVV